MTTSNQKMDFVERVIHEVVDPITLTIATTILTKVGLVPVFLMLRDAKQREEAKCSYVYDGLAKKRCIKEVRIKTLSRQIKEIKKAVHKCPTEKCRMKLSKIVERQERALLKMREEYTYLVSVIPKGPKGSRTKRSPYDTAP